MKIKSDRFDSLQRARQEYDAGIQELENRRNEISNKFHKELKSQASAVEKAVSDAIRSTSLDLDIEAEMYGRYASNDERWSVKVRANQDNRSKADIALSWNWEVSIDREGNIVKDSGSWSGLNVTTPEQIADLEESVRVIKILNDLNWDYILSYPKAKYEDFEDKNLRSEYLERKRNRPDFEYQMVGAQLEYLIGTNTAVQLIGDDYYRGRVGILLTGMTDKFLKGYIFPWNDSYLSKTADEVRKSTVEPRRTSKSKLVYLGNGEIKTQDLA